MTPNVQVVFDLTHSEGNTVKLSLALLLRPEGLQFSVNKFWTTPFSGISTINCVLWSEDLILIPVFVNSVMEPGLGSRQTEFEAGIACFHPTPLSELLGIILLSINHKC